MKDNKHVTETSTPSGAERKCIDRSKRYDARWELHQAQAHAMLDREGLERS